MLNQLPPVSRHSKFPVRILWDFRQQMSHLSGQVKDTHDQEWFLGSTFQSSRED